MALVGMLVFLVMHLISIVGVDINIIGTIISKIVMMVGVYLFSLIWGKEDKRIRLKYYIAPLFVAMGNICIVANGFYSRNSVKEMLLSIITFSFWLLFNIVVLEIYSKGM